MAIAVSASATAPAPFVPPVSVLNGVPLKTAPGPHPHPKAFPSSSKPVLNPVVGAMGVGVGVNHPRPAGLAPSAVPYVVLPAKQHHPQRSATTHIPVPSVPYPVRAPEYPQQQPQQQPSANRLPPRPMGHGRSGASAPPVPVPIPVAPPISVPIPASAQLQTQFQPKEVNHPPVPSHLPKAPGSGGLGLFAPPTPPPPPKQQKQPQPVPQPPQQLQQPRFAAYQQPERSFGGRRATVSNCQPVTLQHDPLDQAEEELMQREHKRLEDLWDQEQLAHKREVEEARKKYEEEKAAAEALRRRRSQHSQRSQDRPASPSRSRSKKSSHRRSGADSPLMNSHGIPTPPATTSPSNKPHKRLSAREEQEKWRKEMDRVMEENRRKQALATAEAERERLEAEEEKHRQETIKAYHRQQHGSSSAPRHAQPQPGPEHGVVLSGDEAFVATPRPRPAWAAAVSPRRTHDPRRLSRHLRRSGYLGNASRSAATVPHDSLSRTGGAPVNPNYRQARPKRFYGEGTNGLREEGMPAPQAAHHHLYEPAPANPWRQIEGAPPAVTYEAAEAQDDQQVRSQPRKMMDESARFAAAAWDLYESRWTALTSKPPKENSLRFIDIPWPSLVPLPPPSLATSLPPPNPLQIAAILNSRSVGAFILSPYHSVGKGPKARLRAGLLRFHPDKVQRWMSLIKEDERDAVVMGVDIVVRCLNELMRKLERA